MAYRGLGSRRQTSALDASGMNPGNWTTHFLANDIAVHVPSFEMYRAVVENLGESVPLRVLLGDRIVSYATLGSGGEWDPIQPPLLEPGQDLYFCWGAAAAGTPPEVTIWLRYQR